MKLALASLILLAVVSTFIKADDLKAKDGKVYKNITVVDSSEYYYSIKFEDGTRSKFRKDLIDEIIHTDGTIIKVKDIIEKESSIWKDPVVEKESDIRKDPVPENPLVTNTSLKPVIKEYPHLGFLTLTVLAGALAVDLFTDVSDTQKQIDSGKKLQSLISPQLSSSSSVQMQEEIERLESTRNTKRFLGIISLIAGAVNTYYALMPVEIKAGPDQVAVSYRYNF